MGKSKRRLFEVRVRAANGKKITKRYWANGSHAAAATYKGPGFVMWTQKAGRGKMIDKKVVWDERDISRNRRELAMMAQAKKIERRGLIQQIRGQFHEVSGFMAMGDEIVQEIKESKKEGG